MIEAGPCPVTQVKTVETDGYDAVQLAFGAVKPKRLSNGEKGHLKKAGAPTLRHLHEFGLDDLGLEEGVKLGDVVTVESFEPGAIVKVTGTSKGRGFQGAVKRHGFGGLKMTHGSMMHRRTGAIGCRSTPGRVWKNQKMPGHMGDVPRTVQNLKVVAVRPEDGVILISGAIPGAKGSYVTVRPAKKKTAAA